jgi:hypothetical protein
LGFLRDTGCGGGSLITLILLIIPSPVVPPKS